MSAAGFVHVLVLIARILAWIAAFVFGQWIAAATGWGPFIWPRFVPLRFIGALIAVIVLMYALDRFLWRRHASPGARLYWREFADAVVIGFFFGVAFAR